MSDELQIRIHESGGANLIYLPGTHGDWTLNSGFRREIQTRVRLIEFTFPRTLLWSLDDYAQAIEEKLVERNIQSGWILAESFGSQVTWAMQKRTSKSFQPHGIILAGGFVRHPIIGSVQMARHLTRTIPLWLLQPVLRAYAIYARIRESDSPEIRAALHEFVQRRTKDDLLAAAHRLELITTNFPQETVRMCRVPTFYLTGFIDPIVPWPFVAPWLKNNCPGFREWKMIWKSDHHVLGASKESAEQILKWMNQNKPAAHS